MRGKQTCGSADINQSRRRVVTYIYVCTHEHRDPIFLCESSECARERERERECKRSRSDLSRVRAFDALSPFTHALRFSFSGALCSVCIYMYTALSTHNVIRARSPRIRLSTPFLPTPTRHAPADNVERLHCAYLCEPTGRLHVGSEVYLGTCRPTGCLPACLCASSEKELFSPCTYILATRLLSNEAYSSLELSLSDKKEMLIRASAAHRIRFILSPPLFAALSLSLSTASPLTNVKEISRTYAYSRARYVYRLMNRLYSIYADELH